MPVHKIADPRPAEDVAVLWRTPGTEDIKIAAGLQELHSHSGTPRYKIQYHGFNWGQHHGL